MVKSHAQIQTLPIKLCCSIFIFSMRRSIHPPLLAGGESEPNQTL